MERGDVWTCLYEGYASKPRPVLIVQDNAVSGQFGLKTIIIFCHFQCVFSLCPAQNKEIFQKGKIFICRIHFPSYIIYNKAGTPKIQAKE